jgi:hypothetical protein
MNNHLHIACAKPRYPNATLRGKTITGKSTLDTARHSFKFPHATPTDAIIFFNGKTITGRSYAIMILIIGFIMAPLALPLTIMLCVATLLLTGYLTWRNKQTLSHP